MNNLFNFKGNEVEIFEYKGEILFNPRDIAKCIGLSEVTVRRHIQDMNENQVIKLTNSDLEVHGVHIQRKLHNTGESFLKEAGVLMLINSSRCSESVKNEFLKYLKLDNKIIVKGSVERNFLYELEESLKAFNIKGIKQFQVLSYKIDYYIPSLNIAIEYDENNHKNYTYEQHKCRQKKIEKELGCKFIRISDSKSNSYNIGYVIKNIFNL